MAETTEDPPINPIWKADYDREPKWLPLTDENLEEFYSRVKEYLNESGEVDNVDWERLNFDLYTPEMVREQIGEGFPDEFYELMAKASLDDNKIQDFRQLPLDKVQGDVVLKMS
jgi:hypothetical protein